MRTWQEQQEFEAFKDKAYYFFSKIGDLIFYIAFIGFSYMTYKESANMYHVWIVANIFEGSAGGFLVVYPFKALGRREFLEVASTAIGFCILCGSAFVIFAIIGSFFGKGTL
jgi:hypothetical protein